MTESGDEGIIMTSIGEDVDSEYMMDEDPTDRYDAARWLRKRVGVVAARDLPAEPSEEDFRLGLRSGMVLCNVINKIKSGSVPKILNAPSALFNTPDATAQAAYVENVSNFLTAVEKLGLPTFDPSDLDPGGDFSCVVDSVLAMKAYSESGASDFTWTPRPSQNRKTLNRRNSEPAMNAFSRTHSVNIDSLLGSADQSGDEDDFEEESDYGPLYMIVSDLLEDRDEEDIPIIVENILNKVKEEFNSRLGITTEDVESPISHAEDKTEETIQKSIEEDRYAKEQERINREKEEKEKAKKKEEERIKREKELLEQQEKAKKEEEERMKREKELLEHQEKARKEEEECVRREKELFEQQEKTRREEEERVRKEKELLEQQEKARREEEERIKREKKLLEQQEKARKEEEERIQREKELLEQQEKETARKEEEERIKRDKELLAQQEKARRQEERRIKKEKVALARKENARKEAEDRKRREKQLLAEQRKAKKEEEARIKREKRELEKQERARRREEERIKRENQSLAQKEKAREEQEQVQREIELLALEEKAKEDEISAMEAEQINRDKQMEEDEEKARKEEDEQELLEIEREKERARKKDYRRTMDEYNKLNVNSPKQHELVGRQDKELQELRNTISTAKSDVRSMQNNCQEEADNLGTHVHTLCQAAAGYKKVLEENRKLYNQVQDLKGSIRVYCRVRPFLRGQENQVTSVDYTDEETVAIIVPSKTGREGRKASMFNKVFGPSSTQEDVFSDTQPLIRSVLDGFNVCVFACGQTGAGKTYTLTGPEEQTPETWGVSYRALNDLFLISEERKNLMNYEISINMVEVYNDEVFDLLVTDGTSKPLEISNSAKKGINVPDAKLVPVSSADEVINLMSLCQKNRAVNDHSNRSHSFLTAHVFGKDVTAGTTTRGCMHLVDLAGNEKLDDSNDEATHVNKSLSALGDVMVALANKSSRVNYKTCKLTQLLQDALGAQAKILMFVHVHPHIDEALETLSTFKFVERFSTVEGGAGKSPEVRELKEQICLLKSALAKKEAGDPGWQDMLSSPRGGDQNGAFEDEKNSSSKQPAKSASTKKPAAVAGSAAKPGKQLATPDVKKKKAGK